MAVNCDLNSNNCVINSWLYVFYSVNKHNMKLTSHQPCDNIHSNVNIIIIIFAITNLIINLLFQSVHVSHDSAV